MLGHKEIIPTMHEKYCHAAKIIQQYMQDNNLYDCIVL